MKDRTDRIRNLIRFSFTEPLRKDRVQGFPRIRDSEAFTELYVALAGNGYRYSDAIINYPDSEAQHEPSRRTAARLGADDLIVLATRPPIRERSKDRKKTRPSNTVIEKRILAACRSYFYTSKRNSIVLSDAVQNEISSSYEVETETKTDVVVYTRPRATYKSQSGSTIVGSNKSPVYLLRLPSIAWGDRPGPELLVVFGMSLPLSLAWAYILRTRYPELLHSPRFLMAELTLPRKLNPTPVSLEAFCGDWEVERIFDLEIPGKPARRETHIARTANAPGPLPTASPDPEYAWAARGSK